LLSDCAARFQCRTAFRYEGGDHVIFVGEVVNFEYGNHAPLLYHGGQYALALPLTPSSSPAKPIAEEPDSSFSQDFLIYLLSRAHHQLFIEIRRELERLGVSEEGWFVLSLLGVADNRPLTELNRLLSYTGKRISYELVAGLSASGLVNLHGSYDPEVHVSLTAAGRQMVIELVAAGKAFESHAVRNLTEPEQRLLKSALRRLIHDTAPALATPWILNPDSYD